MLAGLAPSSQTVGSNRGDQGTTKDGSYNATLKNNATSALVQHCDQIYNNATIELMFTTM